MDAVAVTEDFREFTAVGGAEIGVVEGAGDGEFFQLGAEVGGEVASFKFPVLTLVQAGSRERR